MRDVRNLAHVDLDLPAAGIAIVGENGQGKTNLLEAIAYAHLVRSVRGARDADVTRFGAAGFAIGASAVRGEGGGGGAGSARSVTVQFERAGRRKWATVDHAPAERLSDAIGAIPAVMISPVDVALVRGAPAERRRYLDVTLGTTSRRYLSALQTYRSALLRRNAVLRAGPSAGSSRAVEAAAAVWEPPLAEAGAVVRSERAAWVARWQGAFARLAAVIGERGTTTLRYALGGGGATSENAEGREERAHEEWRDALAAALAADRAVDVRRGATRAGPHRDDLVIAIEGRALPAFGSAGQHRTIAIALRLIEAATIHASGGVRPVLLLDDPFAELDDRRARAVLDLVCEGANDGTSPGQVLLAVPRPSDIPPELVGLERWRIAGGMLARAAGRGAAA